MKKKEAVDAVESIIDMQNELHGLTNKLSRMAARAVAGGYDMESLEDSRNEAVVCVKRLFDYVGGCNDTIRAVGLVEEARKNI